MLHPVRVLGCGAMHHCTLCGALPCNDAAALAAQRCKLALATAVLSVQVALPPDHLNPEGHTTAELDTLSFARPQDRSRLKGRKRGYRAQTRVGRTDQRVISRTPSLPPPGDPKADSQRAHHEMTWTLVCDGDYKARFPVALRHSPVA